MQTVVDLHNPVAIHHHGLGRDGAGYRSGPAARIAVARRWLSMADSLVTGSTRPNTAAVDYTANYVFWAHK
jgi:hypothetical protein